LSPYSGKGYFMSLTQLDEVLSYTYEVGVYVGGETFRIVSENITLPADEWVHMVATYDGHSIALFMSADPSSLTLVKNGTYFGEPLMYGKANAQPMHIGENFFGLIDEVKVFSSVLDHNQTVAHGVCPSHPKGLLHDDDLVAYYRFNEGFGNTTADSSASGVNGIHGLICGEVEQNEHLLLECPTGYAITEILYANFGVNEGSCGNMNHDGDECFNPDTASILMEMCGDQESCLINAFNDIFGNACEGVRKTLAVQALCAPTAPYVEAVDCRSFSGVCLDDYRWSYQTAPTLVGTASSLTEPMCPYQQAEYAHGAPGFANLLMEGGDCEGWDLSTATAGVNESFAIFVMDGCGYVDMSKGPEQEWNGMVTFPYSHWTQEIGDGANEVAQGICTPEMSGELDPIPLDGVWSGGGYCNLYQDAWIYQYQPTHVGHGVLTFKLNEEFVFSTDVAIKAGAISPESHVTGPSVVEAGVMTSVQVMAKDAVGNFLLELTQEDLDLVTVSTTGADAVLYSATGTAPTGWMSGANVDASVITTYLVFAEAGEFDVAVTVANATTTFTVTVVPPSVRAPTVFSEDVPEPRFEHSAVEIDNAMYVFGGAKKDKTYLSETWKLEIGTGPQFQYRSMVHVDGELAAGTSLPLIVNTHALIDSGLMRVDCMDMLFLTEEGAPVAHWVDPLPGCGAEETVVWIKVESPEMELAMYYGAPNYRATATDPATMFDLYEDFAGAVFTEEGGNWMLDSTCVSEQFPAGAAGAFYSTAEGQTLTGGSALKVDTSASVGGSITWHVADQLKYASGYYLKGYLWDSGCDGAHWMSPSFEACESMGAGKTSLPVKNALGINTCVVTSTYVQASPWVTTHLNRTVGWHSVSFEHTGAELIMRVDDVVVEHVASDTAALEDILLHGGLYADTTVETSGFWDSVFVTEYSATELSLGNETESVSYVAGSYWRKVATPSAPPARQAHSAVAMGDSFYVYGGERSAYEYSDIWAFNTSSEMWSFVSPAEDKAPARHDHTAVVYDGKMFVYGGRGPRPLADFWCFDPETSSWAEMPSSSGMAARFGHSAVVLDDTMLVYGGYVAEEGGLTQELWSFNFTTDAWTLLGPRMSNFDELGETPYVADPADAILFPAEIPAARFSHVAIATDAGMFICGGAGGATMRQPLDDCWFFEPSAKSWSVAFFASDGMPSARYDAAAALLVDPTTMMPTIAVFGGHGPSGFLADTQFYHAGHLQ
jgi:hypothetical protein